MHDLKKHEYEIAKNDLEFWPGKNLDENEIPLKLPDQYNLLEDLILDTSKDVELSKAKSVAKLATLPKVKIFVKE